jgi:hypothetical protein
MCGVRGDFVRALNYAAKALKTAPNSDTNFGERCQLMMGHALAGQVYSCRGVIVVMSCS